MKIKTQKQMRVEVASVFVIVVLQLLRIIESAAATSGPPQVRIAKRGCKDRCGNASIPYPFGIGHGCYHSPWFEIECDEENDKFTLKKIAEQIGEPVGWRPQIRWRQGQQIVTVGTLPIFYKIFEYDGSFLVDDMSNPNLEGSPFLFSKKHNILLVSGCGGATMLLDRRNRTLAGCAAFCINGSSHPGSDCYGVDCCQATISRSFNYYKYNLSALVSKPNDYSFNGAVLVDRYSIMNKSKDVRDLNASSQVVLEWTIKDLNINHPKYANSSCFKKPGNANGHGGLVCQCFNEYYEGNPYLPYGCKVVKGCDACVQECTKFPNNTFGCPAKNTGQSKAIIFPVLFGLGLSIGSMLALSGAYWLHQVLKRKRDLRIKALYFERNGGMLLKQQMSSSQDKYIEKIKIFGSDELEKATDQYNEDRILGLGGQGTVYKGMLSDGKIVAIKKSKIVNENLLNIFINEVVLLSQINHRNVVNLLGCCLESEVPMLVYEYVPCGTLSQHIHSPKQDFPVAWEMRLQIATDIANALAYLHSSYSMPIYHRDIKSSNILLDEKYRAKVSDFGISKSVNIDQTHVTTSHVIGTFGYLDPEYFQSSQFTDKSDVYSFGVVLVELLTGQKAVRSEKDEERGLRAWFLGHLEDCKLYEALDARVVREGREEEIMVVAHLAKRCLNLDGKKRPTMKEVAAELETLRSSIHHGLTRNQSAFSSFELDHESASSCIDITLEY